MVSLHFLKCLGSFDGCKSDQIMQTRSNALQDAVYSVAYSYDGKRFASGGADKTVIIWTSKVSMLYDCSWRSTICIASTRPNALLLSMQAEGVVKYNHNDSVQVLAYNPLSQQLASGTASDFGLWSPELKHVAKHKVP